MVAQQSRWTSLKARVQEIATRLDLQDGLNWRQQAIVFLVAALLTASRLPGLLVHAQFYAEDGTMWYGQAYTLGWLHTLAWPYAGYLDVAPRLGAGLEMLVPFRWAPLAGALFGLAIQCLPVTVLLSARCRNWWPLSQRVLVAMLYVGLPNAREIHVVMTNVQWHLTLAVVLLALGSAPRGWAGRLVDVVLFAVCGLSGPFCVALLPVVAVFWWVRRQAWTLAQGAVLAICAGVEMFLLLSAGHRDQQYLGAGLKPLLRIFGGNVIGEAMFGGHGIGHFAPMPLIVLAALGGVLLYAYVLRYGRLELQLFIAYALLLFVAALRSPLAGGERPAWIVLATTSEHRYFFFPMLAFLWGIVWCARSAPHRVFQHAAVVVLGLTMIGVATDWEYRRYPNFDFPAAAERMRVAAPGTPVEITILPNETWHVVWVKKNRE